eukprot:2150263-Pyramimonas_sp.AAC.1
MRNADARFHVPSGEFTLCRGRIAVPREENVTLVASRIERVVFRQLVRTNQVTRPLSPRPPMRRI